VKICYFANAASIHAVRWVKYFADRGHEVHLISIKNYENDRYCKSSCNYYTIRLKDSRLNRNELRKHLESKGIQTMVYYPLSLHLQKVYKYLAHKPGDFPQSELAQEQVLTLPMYSELSEERIEEVVQEVRTFAGR
jgi:dTDP-4-amino-4,6-dideoxygalactose transaminase